MPRSSSYMYRNTRHLGIHMILLLTMAMPVGASEKLHILIPGGTGGGWDTTARGVGEVLSKSKLIETISYENMSGGSGSRAISHLIETAARQNNTLMINSTPIILQSLKGVLPQSYRDLVPVAAVIADYGAFVVRTDSDYHSWNDIIADFKLSPRNVLIAGGSARGSMDHVVAALAFKKSGLNPQQLRYVPYNAGGKAMVGLLSGETQLLSTGLGEAIGLSRQGEVRILAMTAPERLDFAPNIPTLVEQNIPAVFSNWRGFFAAPGFPPERLEFYSQALQKMFETPEWEVVRSRQGWTNLFIEKEAFLAFLEAQEQDFSELFIELGINK